MFSSFHSQTTQILHKAPNLSIFLYQTSYFSWLLSIFKGAINCIFSCLFFIWLSRFSRTLYVPYKWENTCINIFFPLVWSNVAMLHDCSKTHLACWRAVTCVRVRWLPGCPSWSAPLPAGPGGSGRISQREPECLVHTGLPDPPEPVAGARLCATTETPWLRLLGHCNYLYTIIPSSHLLYIFMYCALCSD